MMTWSTSSTGTMAAVPSGRSASASWERSSLASRIAYHHNRRQPHHNRRQPPHNRQLPTNMPAKLLYRILFFAALVQTWSCTSLNITNYYHKHRSTLDSIESVYKTAYAKKPFSIEFPDRPFSRLSLELITDS